MCSGLPSVCEILDWCVKSKILVVIASCYGCGMLGILENCDLLSAITAVDMSRNNMIVVEGYHREKADAHSARLQSEDPNQHPSGFLKTGRQINHIFGLADGTKSYPVGIVKDVEVHIRKLKLLNDFYVIDMKKDPETPLLVERGFLATTNAVIDCRMAKIAVGEGITRSVFGVKGVNLGEEEALY
ncbi:MAK10-like protein [Tanacetum coccineum]